MNKDALKFLILSLLLMLSCFHIPASANSQQLLAKKWIEFLEVIERNDSNGFSSLALPSIKCILCVDYIGGENAMISKKAFFEDNVSSIFTDVLLSRLRTGETKYRKGLQHGIPFFEVLVTTTKPGEVDEYHEGAQHAFMFKLINSEYKFSEISTIP
jgi:hypothetical protein